MVDRTVRKKAETKPCASAYGSRGIAFRDVTVGYAEQVALESISFEVRRGEFLGIIGPNGAGKTTVFKLILGLVEPMAGSASRFPFYVSVP